MGEPFLRGAAWEFEGAKELFCIELCERTYNSMHLSKTTELHTTKRILLYINNKNIINEDVGGI